ncbi:MAG: hypothetical protein R6U61_08695 [Thermoplasmata archaeon]
MSEIVQKYESRSFEPKMSIFCFIFFIPTIVLFTYYLIISGYNDNIEVLFFVIILIAFIFISFIDYIKPRLLVGESFIGIPKVTIFLGRTHKIIKFDEIESIEVIPLKEPNKHSNINMNNIFRIYIVDESGKKYNLHSFKFSEKIIAKNLRKRMGEKLWKEKLFVKPPPKYSLGKK